ncbi:MAG: SDR family oxidoreductase [Saprospiraceae bacterium]|nr:SDR family oxidoreductase [Saprospiraceae bacterium]
MKRLENKTAIVTGGASGIGLAISQRFAAEGAHVHLLDLKLNEAEAAAATIRSEGGLATAYGCDVSDQPQVANVVQAIHSQHVVNILVCNAGIGFVGNLEKTTEEDLDRMYRVNVKGVYNSMHAVVPFFKQNGGGVILNMASIVASVGIPDRFAYSMTKGAVLTMTLSVAVDYLADNIRCNCISPARIHTPFVDGFLAKNYPGQEAEVFAKLAKTQPIGRMGTSEEVAGLAIYLCSDEAAFITGCDFPLDGGFIKLRP